MKLLDTSAWVEFFKGSPLGREVKGIIAGEQVYTSAITLAEITRWVFDNNGDVRFALQQIHENSIIIPVEEPILVESGLRYTALRNRNKKMGLIDVIIYITALLHGLELLTTDHDFKGLPFVILLNQPKR